jgi:hypothetical protein
MLKKLIHKIKLKLKNFIIELISFDNVVNQIYETINNKYFELYYKQKELKQKIDLYDQLLNISVDVHEHSNSWAVICVNGKCDYVKFVDLGQSNIREISRFLRQFEKSNKIIDTPFGMPKDYFLKFD